MAITILDTFGTEALEGAEVFGTPMVVKILWGPLSPSFKALPDTFKLQETLALMVRISRPSEFDAWTLPELVLPKINAGSLEKPERE